jgi:tetratricopeptide (TPR) repeat protein
VNRFPLLNTYRLLLYILAALAFVIGTAVMVTLLISAATNDTGIIRASSPYAIIIIIASTGSTTFSLLLSAEVIKLFLNMEDHLYHIRYDLSLVRSSDHGEDSSDNPEDKKIAGLAFSRGYQAYQARDYEAALRFLSDAITLDPTFAPAYHYRALTYRQLGKDDLARRDLEMAKRFQKHD